MTSAFDSVSGAARDILVELEGRIEELLPDWSRTGPEEPARVLLEAFALALARFDGELERLPDRLLSRLLAALGEEEHWAEPARSVVVFEPRADLSRAVRIAAGTGVTVRRRAADAGVRPSFETARDAWLSPARLVRALGVEAGEAHELPIRPPGSELRRGESYGDVPLFRGTELDRSIYLGDDVWLALRDRPGEVILEWPGVPAAIAHGRWEYSVRGGWRTLPVDFDESLDSDGAPTLRMRALGPLPDIEAHRIEGSRFPWIRLEVATERRFQWPPPRLVWAPGGGDGRRSPGLPRPLARLASRAGARFEDHSFPSTRRVTAAKWEADHAPAVWLGFDRPLPASLFWSAGGSPPSAGVAPPELRWEYTTEDGFAAFTPEDETGAFASSGRISWDLLDLWKATELFGERLYWIRARWVEGGYLDVPRVRSIYPSAVEVIEGRVVRDVPFSGNFSPGELRADVVLPLDGEWSPFEVVEVASSTGEWSRLRVAPGGVRPRSGEFAWWRRPGGARGIELGEELARDSRLRAPFVRVFGREPPPPDLELDLLEAEIDGLDRIQQVLPVRGGRKAETLDELAARVREEWRCGFRAITRDDYERLAAALEPNVLRAVASESPGRPGEVIVVAIARPPFRAGRISPRRLAELSRALEERAPLGTRVLAVEPAWVPLEIDVEIRRGAGDEEDDEGSVRALLDRIESEVRRLLDPVEGGPDARGLPPGAVRGPYSCARWLEEHLGDAPRLAGIAVRRPGEAVVLEADSASAAEEPEHPASLPLVAAVRARVAASEEAP